MTELKGEAVLAVPALDEGTVVAVLWVACGSVLPLRGAEESAVLDAGAELLDVTCWLGVLDFVIWPVIL